MIISFKYKFIFIKTYKTAGTSIESYLYPYLKDKDIVGPTTEYKGINWRGDFEKNDLDTYFEKHVLERKINFKIKYFAHMPIWLVKERLKPLSQKLNYDIFNNFYKFSVIRNPYDTVVSDYYWQNSVINTRRQSTTFEKLLNDLNSNHYPMYRLLNLNKLMDKNLENVMCDKIIKYENLDKELAQVFNKLGIPFSGKLEIFEKKNKRDQDYKKFYDNKSKKLIEDIFWKEIQMFDYKF